LFPTRSISSNINSSENHESAAELSFDEGPVPHEKEPHFLDCSSESSEDDEDDPSNKRDDNVDHQAPCLQTNSEEETTSNPTINLHCNKSIKASYPKNGLQAPFSF
jgi:hypothetical protein